MKICYQVASMTIIITAGLVLAGISPFDQDKSKISIQDQLARSESDFSFQLCVLVAESQVASNEDSLAIQRAKSYLVNSEFSDAGIVTAIEGYLHTLSWQAKSKQLPKTTIQQRAGRLKNIAINRLNIVNQKIQGLPSSDEFKIGLPSEQSDTYGEQMNLDIQTNNAIGYLVSKHGMYDQIRSRLEGVLQKIEKFNAKD